MDMVHHCFHIDGMPCTGCEAVVKREVDDIDDVEQVGADHETGVVECTTPTAATGGYVEQVINDLGYKVAAHIAT